MEASVSSLGAIVGLLLAIVLIVRKFHPVYSLMTGAFVGGVLGGCPATKTVELMIAGSGAIMPAVLRVISAGILAGVLIESGAARKIADVLIAKVGNSRALIALALATMVLTMVGVFVDVAVITVSPIALATAVKADLSRTAMLLALIGGGKAGNIMSPNPNTIVLSERMNVPLTNLMLAGVLPAMGALIMTCLLAHLLRKKGTKVVPVEGGLLPTSDVNIWAALTGPMIAIILLALRPVFGIKIDPLLALPVGGFIGLLALRKIGMFGHCATAGLTKMAPVALLLIGTGTLAGMIAASDLKTLLINIIEHCGMPAFAIAPLSGVVMSAATASTVAGSTVASSIFGQTIIGLGIAPLAGAVMIHTGATVFDTLPHGSFFHASAGAGQMEMNERLRLLPFETLIGLTATFIACLLFGILL